MNDIADAEARARPRRLAHFLAVFGPGLVVMLADTDVGSVITAGQSGVQWGYRLLALQFALMPILYVVQELTVRLGIFTGRGHGELIRSSFGPVWAWVSVAGLGIATIGALITEFSGVAGIGELYGLPRAATLPIAALALLAIVITGSYRRVERAAIAVGLFELAFFFVAWAAHPDPRALLAGSIAIPFADRNYLYLVAANIGAVIMPWMVFYQQSAIADKKLRPEHFAAARWDTAAGSVLTQLVMAAVLIACAATIGRRAPDASLNTVGEMAGALTPFLGTAIGNAVFGAGVLGAGMVAAIVASLALAWGLGEVSGYRHSLEFHPLQARWFYGVYAVCVIGCAGFVGIWPNLVALNVGVQVMNALLLPIVLGFLIALARRALPPGQRLRGGYFALVIAIAAVTCALGVFGGFSGAGLLP
ncbi:MAG: divalent metal cation transporter [Rhodospirillales bacterium]|nr:divalent metal cation transporter [Rhodospirillales bacterium]